MSARLSPLLQLKARVSYPAFTLDVDQDIALEGSVGLFGASGSGKSTLLRVIAGFEKGAHARITFDGRCWQDSSTRRFIPAHRRPAGLVFQDTRLFTHRNVAGNLAYADSRSKKNGNSISREEILAAFDLQSLLSRDIRDLSGGERQRVAIARTLLTQPRILLLDEPLAALDSGRKSEILPYLETLPERFGVPVIYVSHSIEEVARLCDRVLVLDQGRVCAFGNATDVLNDPSSLPSRLPLENVAVIEARVVEQLADLYLTKLSHSGQFLVVPLLSHLPVDTVVRLNVRATDVALATQEPHGISFRNVLRGTLTALDEDPGSAFALASVRIGDGTLRAQLTRHAVNELGLKIGMPLFALVKTASFDRKA